MPARWRGECLFGQIHAEIVRGRLDSPFTICDRIAEPYKKRCYQIIQVAAEYYLNSSEKDNVCQNTPKKFKYITCKLTK